MTSAGQTVCLCMIVKNERHVLRRCLHSVRPFIDRWIIVDTGSTDGTQELVRECYAGLPGELVERPWKNFGWNRSEAVELARGTGADYLLTLDADEYLRADAGFQWPSLTADAYAFTVDSGGFTFTRIQLVRAALPWRYEGVLHEYITCDMPHGEVRMPGVTTMRLLEGARSRDPLTYRRDAEVLEEALRQDPENARHVFYLAQSYRDARQPEQALQRYRQRARMAGFAEEVWCSLYEAARLMHQQGEPWQAVHEAYLDAYRYRPWRAEPLYRIGQHLRQTEQYAEALPCLRQALRLPVPESDILFVDTAVYRFLVPREYMLVCFCLGLHEEAATTADRLLTHASLLSEERIWIENARRLMLSPSGVQANAG